MEGPLLFFDKGHDREQVVPFWVPTNGCVAIEPPKSFVGKPM